MRYKRVEDENHVLKLNKKFIDFFTTYKRFLKKICWHDKVHSSLSWRTEEEEMALKLRCFVPRMAAKHRMG